MAGVFDQISKPLAPSRSYDLKERKTKPSLFEKIAKPIADVAMGAAQQTLKGLGLIGQVLEPASDFIDTALGVPGRFASSAVDILGRSGVKNEVPARFSEQFGGAVKAVSGNETAGKVAGFAALLAEPFGLPGKASKLLALLAKEKTTAGVMKLLGEGARGLSKENAIKVAPAIARSTSEKEIKEILARASKETKTPEQLAKESFDKKWAAAYGGRPMTVTHITELDKTNFTKHGKLPEGVTAKEMEQATAVPRATPSAAQDAAALAKGEKLAEVPRASAPAKRSFDERMRAGESFDLNEFKSGHVDKVGKGVFVSKAVPKAAKAKVETPGGEEASRRGTSAKELAQRFADDEGAAPIDGVYLVGSRAKGTPNANSDWDFVVVGKDYDALEARKIARLEDGERVEGMALDVSLDRRARHNDIIFSSKAPKGGVRVDTPKVAKASEVVPPVKPPKPPKTPKSPESDPFPVPKNPTNPTDSAVAKLAKAIREAKPFQKDIAAEQAAARAERIGNVTKGGYGRGGGKQAFISAMGKLKGELSPKARFSEIESKLTASEIDSLYSKIETAPHYLPYEKLSIQQALSDLLRGEVPEPQQLEHLEDIFGSDVISALQKQLSEWKKWYAGLVDILNLPRTAITSYDMSAPLRQGILAVVRHPILASKAFTHMFRVAFSEKNFAKWLDDIKITPEYAVAKRSGLYIADPRKLSGGLAAREEAFISRYAEKVPGIKASQRAYLGFLNKLRYDSFNQTAKTFAAQGAGSPKDLRALADLINVMTGRGDLGRFGRLAPELNAVFFSPRLIASRLAWFNPKWYMKQTPAVRIEAAKTMASFIGAGTTILGLASLGGADVELDPRSSDFGKIKVGDTRWDIWGGFQQWVRVFSQLAPSTNEKGEMTWQGHRKTAKGEIQELTEKDFPFDSRFDVIQNFVTGKAAPIVALGIEMLKGQQMMGGDLTVEDAAIKNAIPLYMQDVYKAYKEDGALNAAAAGIPAFFGVGVQTYGGKTSAATDRVKSGSTGLPKFQLKPSAAANIKLKTNLAPSRKYKLK